MVWQAGLVSFSQFGELFIPSVINFALPAFIMSLFIPKEKPEVVHEFVEVKRGAKRIVLLFLLTILTAVGFHGFVHFHRLLA